MMTDAEQYTLVGGLISLGVAIFFIVKTNEIASYLKEIRDILKKNNESPSK